MTILVCGEALVDLFVRTDEVGLKSETVLGGSPFNVAIGLARLGVSSSFLGGISSDAFGEAIRARLLAETVDLSHAVRSDRLTTISVVAIDAAGHPAYAFHGENKADREIRVDDLPQALGEDVTAIVLGSYTLAVEPVASSHLALARREAGRRLISIDPNLRPSVTPDLAKWRGQFAKFLPFATIVKASEEDLAVAFPGVDHRDLAQMWFGLGVRLCVVTCGARGAIALRPGRAPLSVPGLAIDAVDTVGAGDSFHAALLARLEQVGHLSPEGLSGLSDALLKQVIEFAVAASALTCSRRGSDPPRLAEMTSGMIPLPSEATA